MEIEKIDSNLSTSQPPALSGIVFYNAKEPPFGVYGLYDVIHQPVFVRMPPETAADVGKSVYELSYHTAGGRIRFATDAASITVHAKLNRISRFSHMPLSGSAGFDLYVEQDGKDRYLRSFIPPYTFSDEYTLQHDVGQGGLRYYTLNLPSYAGVDALWIGLNKGAALFPGRPYANGLPLVYYGSSITQGACASRPGNAYTNIISRRCNLDYLNFGFSGSGKGEPAMVQYLAGLSMSAFISDYDHNAPSAAHLEQTHLPLYRAVRKAHPHIPYIVLSKCDVDKKYEDAMLRRQVIKRTCEIGWAEGDKNLYFIDGAAVYGETYREECVVDGCHPGDRGMSMIADALEQVIRPLMDQLCK